MRFLLASVIASLKKAYGLCRQPNLIHTVGVRIGGIKSACSGRRNYRIENLIRPIAVGRSNWLFAGSLRAGQRAAAIMSLVHTARINGHEPLAYLTDVLNRLPTHPASRIEELRPYNWQPAQIDSPTALAAA